MRYESLIFDIDGTLWDSRALVAEGYNIQLEKEGLSHLAVNAELFRPLFGKVMTEIADIIFPSIPVPERYALMERCMDTENRYLQKNECRIGYPGVRETMEMRPAIAVPFPVLLALSYSKADPVSSEKLYQSHKNRYKYLCILTENAVVSDKDNRE